MTPRPRRVGNRDLPTNLYFNRSHKSYIYRNPQTGKRHGMGTDKTKAIAAAKKLNLILTPSNSLVDLVLGESQTLSNFLDYYSEQVMPERELAAKTVELYTLRIKQIRESLGDIAVADITVKLCAEFLDSMKPRPSNQARALLIDILNHAASKGLCPDNPAALTMPRPEKTLRKRHTADGIKIIYAAAEPWLKNAIDMALLTAQRREDIVNMRFDDIKNNALHIIQTKTKRHSDAGWLRMPLTPQLKALVSRCREDGIPSPFLIHRAPDRRVSREELNGRHWTQIKPEYLTRAFTKLVKETGCYDHLAPAERPTFHELRAYSLHLYKAAGRDAKTIAGHTTEKMTRNYQAGHDEIVWVEAIADLNLAEVTG